MLKAVGVATCADLLTHRALLAATFSPLSLNFFLTAALGLGATRHSEPEENGGGGGGEGPGRKGISCERTFRCVIATARLVSTCVVPPPSQQQHQKAPSFTTQPQPPAFRLLL